MNTVDKTTASDRTTGTIDRSRIVPAAAGLIGSVRSSKLIGRLSREYAIVWICAVLFTYMSIASNVFLTKVNATNLLDQWSTTGIIAVAGTFVLISRMFDLSVGSVYALSGVVAAWTAVHTGSVWLAFLAGLAAGVVVGLANGLAVAIGNINPFIVTLATSLIVTGIAVWISQGVLITVTNPSYTTLGQGTFLTLTVPGVLFLVVAIIGWFVLARTTYGRRVYAIGGNPEAARLSGVGVRGIHISVFVMSGLASALAGFLASSRIGSGEADVGTTLPLIVIATVVVGGTSIFGGEGAIWRTFLGVMLYAMVGNGFALLNVNANVQQIIQGLILLIAVGIDAWSRKQSR